MTTEIKTKLMGSTINTAGGKAKYLQTEIEDEFERWNDNWKISDGFWVIHEGKEHHVFEEVQDDN